jgi:prephenate dehydrogenase
MVSIRKLALIGVGLIGGSLARALHRVRACRNIVGAGRNEAHLRKAQELGVIDAWTLSFAEAVKDADMIVLATPLGTMRPVMRQIARHISPDAFITDVGSAKASVVEDARATLGQHFPRFVPGHPIAGTEKSGVEHSFAELFEKRVVILTPLPETAISAIEGVRDMWGKTGAEVLTLDVAHHDQVLAATSHLPHMLAYALVDCLAQMQDRDEIFRFAAGGFADFTRIASSSPDMWHDVCMANREALLAVMKVFDSHLAGIQAAIENNDSAALRNIFTRAKNARDAFQSSREPAPAPSRRTPVQ